MKVAKEKENEIPRTHVKTASQDFGNPSINSNIYVTKLINQNKNKIKSENLINESLPNLKTNIQNIFSNEDSKEKVFRYLIQKNKDRNINTSKEVKRALQTPEIKPIKKIQIQTKRIISPYNNKNYYSINPIIKIYDSNKSCADLRQTEIREKNENNMNNRGYRYSVASQPYMYPDEPFGQNNNVYRGNENSYWQNNNNTFTNLLTNNNTISVNRNRGNKYEHISIYNTYNNTFNNYRMQKNNKNLANQTYDYGKYGFRNTLVKKNKNPLEENPYKEYLKNSNIRNFKQSFLEKSNKNIIIDISDSENKDNKNNIDINQKSNKENQLNKNNNYVKRVNNERIKVQKNENLNMKKHPTKNNNILIMNKSNNNFYIPKKLGYKNFNLKKNAKNESASAQIENKNKIETNDKNENIANSNNKYEKRKNYYDIYGHKDIHVGTLGQKNHENENTKDDDKKNELNVNTIKVNIDKNILKDYNNSPLSNRYNKYFIDNKNKLPYTRFNKKTYEKRDTIQRSPKPNYNNIESNNNNNNNKLVFNDEQEVIDYIKKKYNKRNIDEIISRGNNNKVIVEPKNEKKNRYMAMITSEEGKKIKEKNEELSTEIKNLKFENRQYKKELNDMKNRFNVLSKEINTIKENK